MGGAGPYGQYISMTLWQIKNLILFTRQANVYCIFRLVDANVNIFLPIKARGLKLVCLYLRTFSQLLT